MNDQPLKNRIALITGSSRGIGRAIALAYARAGAAVVVNYVGGEAAAGEVVAAIKGAGGRAVVVQGDVAKLEDHARLLAAARSLGGVANVLVNNAAVEQRAPVLDCTAEEWDRHLDVNLKGVFFLSQAFARELVAAGRPGRIINVSSTHETRPLRNAAIYNITKGGLAMLTKSLALELAPRGITVNGLVPGAIRTDLNRAVLADPAREAAVLAKIPLGRIAEAEDLAAAAVFMAGDGAAYMNGANVTLDGGLML